MKEIKLTQGLVTLVDNEPEIKAKLKAWFPDTKVLIVETGEIIERNVIFE